MKQNEDLKINPVDPEVTKEDLKKVNGGVVIDCVTVTTCNTNVHS